MDFESRIIPPTAAVLRVCDALEMAMARFGDARDGLSVGTYEADVEALLIFGLGLKHVQAVTSLARRDLSFVPTAYSVARAALESCVRAAWLVDEEDPLLREARWIAHLDGELSAIRRTAQRRRSAGSDTARSEDRLATLGRFRDDVAAALRSRGVEPLKQVPNFAALLSGIGGEDLYTTYIEASQYTHGGHQATWLYRGGGVGSFKEIGERIVPQHWILPLRMCWLAVGHPGDVVVTRIAGRAEAGWSAACATAVDAAFRDLVHERPGSLH